MSKHTKGPWKIITADNGLYQIYGEKDGRGECIGNIRNVLDANLIAAAPELLESLKNAVATIEHLVPQHREHEPTRQVLQRMRASIAKAEGADGLAPSAEGSSTERTGSGE